MKKQNVVLKVGIGLVLGVGAMTFAPKAAHATTPCSPQLPPTTFQCEDGQPPTTSCRQDSIGAEIRDGCYYTDAQHCYGLGAYNKETDVYTCTSLVNGQVISDICYMTMYIYDAPCYEV